MFSAFTTEDGFEFSINLCLLPAKTRVIPETDSLFSPQEKDGVKVRPRSHFLEAAETIWCLVIAVDRSIEVHFVLLINSV